MAIGVRVMGKRWTKDAEKLLLQGVGVYGTDWFVQRCGGDDPLGKTEHCVRAKAARMYGSGGLTRGTYSLNQLMTETGYSRTQLLRAMRATAQKWKRLSTVGPRMISEEQREELLEWLQHDYWSVRLRVYACLHCGTSTRPHYSRGLCLSCFFKYRTMLKRFRLPTTAQGLKEVVQTTRKLKTELADRLGFLDLAERRLKRGHALTRAEIKRLVLLRQSEG